MSIIEVLEMLQALSGAQVTIVFLPLGGVRAAVAVAKWVCRVLVMVGGWLHGALASAVGWLHRALNAPPPCEAEAPCESQRRPAGKKNKKQKAQGKKDKK